MKNKKKLVPLLSDALVRLDACEGALAWVRAHPKPTFRERWEECERGDWMIWLAARVRIPDATLRLIAADCAEEALPIYERERPGDDRPRRAIEAARAYARGEIDGEALAAARAAARAAVWAAVWAARTAALSARAATDATDAAEAAAWAARAARDAAEDAAEDAAWAAAGRSQAAIVRRHVPADVIERAVWEATR